MASGASICLSTIIRLSHFILLALAYSWKITIGFQWNCKKKPWPHNWQPKSTDYCPTYWIIKNHRSITCRNFIGESFSSQYSQCFTNEHSSFESELESCGCDQSQTKAIYGFGYDYYESRKRCSYKVLITNYSISNCLGYTHTASSSTTIQFAENISQSIMRIILVTACIIGKSFRNIIIIPLYR